MVVSDFFDPVSLERSQNSVQENNNLFCQNIVIHTPDIQIKDISQFQIAILGVPESRGALGKNQDFSCDSVREELYKLNFIEKKVRIVDLGNLKPGKELKDTYYGLREVIIELVSKNVLPVIIGGSQDLTYGAFLAFEYLKNPYTLATFDYRIDVAFENYNDISNKNYLNAVILENSHLFEYINIGHQACFSTIENFELFENLFHESIRLGILRNNVKIAEPFIRDSDIISIDLSCVKHADAPGQATASPNGFNAEDICQLARYAGLGEKLKFIGIFELCPEFDHKNVTSALTAQVLWYFFDGFSYKVNEDPLLNPIEFKKYIVSFDEHNTITFYKSLLTYRWWYEVPSNNEKNYVLSCTEEDYLNASKNEIPDRWLKILKKIN